MHKQSQCCNEHKQRVLGMSTLQVRFGCSRTCLMASDCNYATSSVWILSATRLWWACVLGLRERVATQGLHSASVHLYTVSFLSDEMRRETCIICNRYHSLMCLCSPWQPIMDRFWGSQHLVWLCDGDGMGTVGVTWEETRRTMGPFIYLSGSWHCKHLTWCAYRECLYEEWQITTQGEKKLPFKTETIYSSLHATATRDKRRMLYSASQRWLKGAGI